MHLRLLPIISLALLFPTSALAITAELDLDEKLIPYLQATRTSSEKMESTSLQSKELTELFKEISYPVSWVFAAQRLPTVGGFGMSKDLSRYLVQHMSFEPTRELNGALNVHTPLTPHISPRFFRPILLEDSALEFEYLTFTPLLTMQLESLPLYRTQFVISEFSGDILVSRKTTLRRYDSLEDIAKGFAGSLHLSDSLQFGGDTFVPSVNTSKVTDARLAGLPAKQLDMVYERMGRNYTYRGICTMRDLKVACAEMSAAEKDFVGVEPIFKDMLLSLRFKESANEGSPVTSSITKKVTGKKTPAMLRREAREKRLKKGA